MPRTPVKQRIHDNRGKTWILIAPNEQQTQEDVYQFLKRKQLYPLAVSQKLSGMYLNTYIVYFYQYQTYSELKDISEDYAWWTLYEYNKKHRKEFRIYKDPKEYQQVLNLSKQISYAIAQEKRLEKEHEYRMRKRHVKYDEITDDEINRLFDEYEDDIEMINMCNQVEGTDIDILQKIGDDILTNALSITSETYNKIFKKC